MSVMSSIEVGPWRVVFFFFQAEDGIRDVAVTGVQTCALPISGLKPHEIGRILLGVMAIGIAPVIQELPHNALANATWGRGVGTRGNLRERHTWRPQRIRGGIG